MPHVHLFRPQTRARAGGQGHRLAQTLDGLSQQQALIQQFNQSADALTQLELASLLSRDKLAQLRAEQ
ncbi:hypothetical protein [Aeromonas rivipollensis]|uniref:hypothetical protein n=1 Tax=Aeromonas rivipollensis TaxID=948519 RepID=UPI00373AE915